jgi:CheY-like chemotaxis protein
MDIAEHSNPASLIAPTTEELQHFQEAKNQKPYRKQLHVLVVEDQVFSQKLICEIIRGARQAGGGSLATDAVFGARDAWNLFVKKAHDIAFIDLVLPDGGGHALTRAIKELDPTTCVVIVTANNYDEEISVAWQSNVDGFVAKPYNKKQILDYIDKYGSKPKAHTKGALHGTSD